MLHDTRRVTFNGELGLEFFPWNKPGAQYMIIRANLIVT